MKSAQVKASGALFDSPRPTNNSSGMFRSRPGKPRDSRLPGFFSSIVGRRVPLQSGGLWGNGGPSRDGPPPWNPERRAQLPAELGTYYARLYGLTSDELRLHPRSPAKD